MASFFSGLFSKQSKSTTSSARRVVGVDIGQTSIKVVEVENREGVLTLTTYGEIQVGPYSDAPIGQQSSLSAKAEQSAVIDLFRESAVKANNGVFAVPLTTSFVTVVTIPDIGDEESDIGAHIQVAARKYIPIPIKEVTLDWAEIGDSKQKKGSSEVLLAAIQNDALDRLHNLMEQITMPKQPTEIECFSVIRSALPDTQDTHAIVDLGGAAVKLYLVRNGLLEQIHRVQTGGANATQKIADALGLSFEAAELRKRSVTAQNPEEVVVSNHEKTFQSALQECHRFLTEYEKKHDHTVANVYLTGGASLFPGIQAQVSNILGRDTSMARPFAKVSYPAFMEDVVEEIGPSFAIALGAALRSFE